MLIIICENRKIEILKEIRDVPLGSVFCLTHLHGIWNVPLGLVFQFEHTLKGQNMLYNAFKSLHKDSQILELSNKVLHSSVPQRVSKLKVRKKVQLCIGNGQK